jgi:uncharacterized protein (TIGR02996 family)
MIDPSTYTAFVHAMHHAPDDDAPRLILCDWLEEHGEVDQAALIRWMIRTPSYTFDWSRRAQSGRHRHSEGVAAIRGLKVRVQEFYRGLWESFLCVESVTVRRGFSGKFFRVEGEVLFAFGKYKGQPLTAVAEDSTDYPRWMLDQNFFADMMDLELRALADDTDEPARPRPSASAVAAGGPVEARLVKRLLDSRPARRSDGRSVAGGPEHETGRAEPCRGCS